MRGWTTKEAEEAFAWISEEYVLPRLHAEMVTRLRDHQADGNRVILLSGTFTPLLTEIGRRLGVEETVGTTLVMKDGHYTGASESPVCQGRFKVTHLEQYLERG